MTSRHPMSVWWSEIAHVLAPGGSYLAQHVGANSLRDLSEFLMGAATPSSSRDPDVERQAAEDAGLVVRELRVERPATAFHDVGAVVYFLRLVRELIEAEDDLVVVGEAGTAEEAYGRIPATSPNVAVLDVRLPDGDGIEVCGEIRSKHPRSPA